MSNVSSYQYLKFVPLKDFYIWDYESYFRPQGVNHYYPLVKLSEILTHRNEFITIDGEQEYKRCKVQLYGRGIILRDIAKGKDIKVKRQQVCKMDEILVAEIDAKLGGYGLLPSDLEGAIVSSHYFLFQIDFGQIDKEYLDIYLKTEEFFKQVKSTGSTNYAAIRPYHFLSYEISLPPKDIQHKLVKVYQSAMNEAAEAERCADEIEQSIENYLIDVLEIEITKTESKKGLQFVPFKDLERWDIWNAIGKSESKLYNNAFLSDVTIGKPQYGANVRAIKKFSDCRYIRITDINESGELNDDFVSAEKVEDKYILKQNDLLIARSGATVGKTFLYDEKYGKAIYAGYLVKYVLDINKVVPKYFLYFSKSKVFKNWLLSQQRISAQPNINGQEFLASPLILPPLPIQKKIVGEINSRRKEIKILRETAKMKRELAKTEFENALFEE